MLDDPCLRLLGEDLSPAWTSSGSTPKAGKSFARAGDAGVRGRGAGGVDAGSGLQLLGVDG